MLNAPVYIGNKPADFVQSVMVWGTCNECSVDFGLAAALSLPPPSQIVNQHSNHYTGDRYYFRTGVGAVVADTFGIRNFIH